MFTWSYSSLTAFETCPRKYYHLRVAKDVVERPGEQQLWGTAVHEAIERRIKDKAPLPDGMTKHEQLVARIADAQKGEVFAETKLTINNAFAPTQWSAADAWCRGIVDAGIKYDQKIVAFDWKTGKVREDSDQLRLFSALLLHHHADVREVQTCFVWLAHDRTTTGAVTRDELPDVWNSFLPRVQRMQAAFDWQRFPPRPSGLCRKWCPVANCEFHGK
jgi:hypothetical protein